MLMVRTAIITEQAEQAEYVLLAQAGCQSNFLRRTCMSKSMIIAMPVLAGLLLAPVVGLCAEGDACNNGT